MRRHASAVLVLLVLATLMVACNRSNQTAEPQPSPSPSAQPTGQGQAQSGETPALKTRPAPGTEQAAAPERQPILVPEGTDLTVKVSQAMGSKISQADQTFQATVAQPIQVNGVTAIPQGSEVLGHVTEAAPLGRFKGGAKLGLALDAVVVHGKKYPVVASLSRTAQGKGKRTAGMVGGGAGLGAVIGAIAGGGKGAAIGALAGAGAGTAGTAFTGNKDIVIPAESALSFKLQRAVEIK